MSELITDHASGGTRRRLLTTASALALLTSVSLTGANAADDADRPTVWIELGGQLERMDNAQEVFAPSFVTTHLNAPYNVVSPLSAQRPPRRSFGGEGKVSFEPEGTDWVFSAAIRYGRSNGGKHLHQQTMTNLVQKTSKYNNPIWGHHAFITKKVTRFNDAEAAQKETHAVLDFMAGKDVGLGMFGQGSKSVVALGVRFAQFHTLANAGFKSFPDPHYSTQRIISDPGAHHHSYFAQASAERNFRGIGPAISWEGVAPLSGNADDGGLTFDWGANAALLFGRQRASGNHHTSSRYMMGSPYGNPPPPTSHTSRSVPFARSRSKIVPNVGGFLGLSARYSHAKFSFGYRGDFFFGAMDGGIDARSTKNVSFHGPFATVSIGLP